MTRGMGVEFSFVIKEKGELPWGPSLINGSRGRTVPDHCTEVKVLAGVAVLQSSFELQAYRNSEGIRMLSGRKPGSVMWVFSLPHP